MHEANMAEPGIGSALSLDMRNKVAEARRQAQDCEINEAALPWGPGTSQDFAKAFDSPIRVVKPFLADKRLATSVASTGRVCRSDLFAIAAPMTEELSPREAVAFAVNVNAWGYGPTGYGYSRTRKTFDYGDAEAGTRAAEAIRILRACGPAAAYHYLYNKGANESGATGHVRNWGPAFFTKFLYFADPGNQPAAKPEHPTALVLDQFLAAAVNTLTPTHPVGKFKKNGWTTPQYAFYISLLNRLASDVSTDTEPVSGGMVEAVLFKRYASRR